MKKLLLILLCVPLIGVGQTAEAIAIPNSNYVLRGDSFRARIILSAKYSPKAPKIYIGDYKSSGNGNYEMIGSYKTVKSVNGEGVFTTKTRSEGIKKWGGLIELKTRNGKKTYPFKGEYLVAARTIAVSPTKMNVFYIGLESIDGNPIQISVPGYTASEITATINNGTLKIDRKSEGKYNVFPSKVGDAIVSLYATNVDGQRAKMGEVKFRVRKPPLPSSLIASMDANGRCDRVALKNDIVQSVLEDFEFDGLKYVVTGFKLSGTYKSSSVSDEQENGMDFTADMKTIITNSVSGSTINISKIKAKLIGSKLPPDEVEGDIVIEIN